MAQGMDGWMDEEINREGEGDRQKERQIDGWMDGQMDKEIDREGEGDRQRDRQIVRSFVQLYFV